MFCDEEALKMICEFIQHQLRYTDENFNVALKLMKDADALLFLSSIVRNQIEVYEVEVHIKHECLKTNKSCFSKQNFFLLYLNFVYFKV